MMFEEGTEVKIIDIDCEDDPKLLGKIGIITAIDKNRKLVAVRPNELKHAISVFSFNQIKRLK